MMAKRPEERFGTSLSDVIKTLEVFLGSGHRAVRSAGRSGQPAWSSVGASNDSAPSARIRSWLLAIVAACCALAILCLLTGR